MGNAATRAARAARTTRAVKCKMEPPTVEQTIGSEAVLHSSKPLPQSLTSMVELPQGGELKELVSMITSTTQRFVSDAEIERRVPSRATNELRKKKRFETKELRQVLLAGGQSGGNVGEPDGDDSPEAAKLLLVSKFCSF